MIMFLHIFIHVCPVGKESKCSAGDQGSIPGFRRCPREGSSNPLQYSCLKNPVN